MVINLVCTIDVNRQTVDFGGIKHLDAQRLQARGGGYGARHGPFDLVFHAGQRINELVDGRTRAHAHHFTGHHGLQGGLAHQRL